MKLIKFFIKFIICIVILVAILLGIAFYALSDATDEAPIDVYTEDTTVDSVLTPLLNESLTKLKDSYAIDLNLDSATLNKLMFAIIRKNINPNYLPNSGDTDEVNYIYSDVVIPDSTPVLGGSKLLIKSAYTTLSGDKLSLALTVDGFGILKTKLTITFKITSLVDSYVLEITELKLGKLDLKSGIGKSIYDFAISRNIITQESINQTLKSSGLPFVFDLANLVLSSTKSDFGAYLKTLIVTDEETDSSTVLNDFIDILVDPDKNIITLETTNSLLHLGINLSLLKVDEEKTTVSDNIKEEFVTDLFVKNKVQTFAINYLATKNKQMTFTDVEFSQLIYNETNGYQDLNYSTEIIPGVNITFSVLGITVDITPSQFTITLIIDINGLKTIGVITGIIEQVSDTEIYINLADTVTLGDDLKLNSSFIKSILSLTMTDNDILPYNETENRFELKASVFNGFIAEAMVTTSLEVEKIEFKTGGLLFSLSTNNPTFDSLLDTVSSTIDEILHKDFINTEDFNTADPVQSEAVENIVNTLSDIASSTTSPTGEIAPDLAESLIESINSLSQENQEVFVEKLQSEFATSDLSTLYDEIFQYLN